MLDSISDAAQLIHSSVNSRASSQLASDQYTTTLREREARTGVTSPSEYGPFGVVSAPQEEDTTPPDKTLINHRQPWLLRRPVEPKQYVSLTFGQKARAAGIAQSMGSRGDCFDNAVAESFFATLKKELIHRRAWPTKAELRGEVFEYIEVFYNRQRRHKRLGQLSPNEYERLTHPQHQKKAMAA